jgi:hypothetical protein
MRNLDSRLSARAVRIAATGAAILAIMLGGAVGPASASTEIQVSRDGVTFTSSLPTALFNQITVTVPGDSQAVDLYVRNASSAAGFLRVSLSNVTVSDPVLAHALTVSAGTTSYPGSSATLADAQPCRVLTEGELVPPGGVVKVSANLALGDLSGRTGQDATATFSFQISLSDAVVGSVPPTVCSSGVTIPVSGGGGTIPLAMTGAEPPIALIIGAASVIGVGLFFVVAARRRKEPRE